MAGCQQDPQAHNTNHARQWENLLRKPIRPNSLRAHHNPRPRHPSPPMRTIHGLHSLLRLLGTQPRASLRRPLHRQPSRITPLLLQFLFELHLRLTASRLFPLSPRTQHLRAPSSLPHLNALSRGVNLRLCGRGMVHDGDRARMAGEPDDVSASLVHPVAAALKRGLGAGDAAGCHGWDAVREVGLVGWEVAYRFCVVGV